MRHFLEFTKRYVYLLVFTVLVTIATFGLYLIHADDVLTDTEFYIVQTDDVCAFFEKIGRFGLVFSKKLFSTDRYVPFIFLFYMMLAMTACVFVFDFCVHNLVMPEYRTYLPLFSIFSMAFLSAARYGYTSFIFIFKLLRQPLPFCWR